MRIRDLYSYHGYLVYVILEEGDPTDEVRIWHIHYGDGYLVFHEQVIRYLGEEREVMLNENLLTTPTGGGEKIPCENAPKVSEGHILLRIPKDDFEKGLEQGDMAFLFETLPHEEEGDHVILKIPLS